MIATAPEPAFIAYHRVAKSFAGQPVLRRLDLAITRGEVMYLVGTSGVGKSVTIKLLIGLQRIDGGEIWFDGRRIDTLPERALAPLRKRIGMVFQSATLFDAMTLAENVALPLCHHRKLAWADAIHDARRRLVQVDMADHADRYPGELSDGMRKRAAIARTLALDPEVVLFDEPTTGLDPVSARRIDRLIATLAHELGVTVIVVSHDLTSILGTADRIALLYQGGVRALGSPSALRDSLDPVVQQFLTGQSSGSMETPGF